MRGLRYLGEHGFALLTEGWKALERDRQSEENHRYR